MCRLPMLTYHAVPQSEISLEMKGFSGIKSQRAVPAFPWTLFNEVEHLILSTYHVLCNARSSQLHDVVFLFSFDNREKWNTGYIVWLTHVRTDAAYPDRSPSHASKSPSNCPTLPSGKSSGYGVILCLSDALPCLHFLSLKKTPKSRPHCQGFQSFPSMTRQGIGSSQRGS